MNQFLWLYKKCNNPLYEDDIMTKIVLAYTKEHYLYDELAKIGAQPKEETEYPSKDVDLLYSSLFNLWKYNVINMEYDTEKEKYLEKLKERLKRQPDIHTYEEFCEISKNNPFIANYSIVYPDKDWVYISSKNVNGTREKDINPQFRLYINADARDLYKVVSIFISSCYKRGLPYDLKFIKNAEYLSKRADTIVLWSDEKNLFKHINILNEIQDKRSDMISRCGPPPILTMKINEWVGFGEEPPQSSYTDYRAEVLNQSIEEALFRWIIENKHNSIKYGEVEIPISEYILKNSIKRSFENYKKNYENEPEEFVNKTGLTLKELNKELYLKIYNEINAEFSSTLDSREWRIKYNTGNGSLYLNLLSSFKSICTMLTSSEEYKKDFFELIRGCVKQRSKEYGICEEKFCFNSDFLGRAIELDELEK